MHEPVYFCFNDSGKYSNQHIAIAGKSGSGKTQFAMELMKQFYEQTHGKLNFLFLDFKGVSEDDKSKMKDFLRLPVLNVYVPQMSLSLLIQSLL